MERPNYRIVDADEGPSCWNCVWLDLQGPTSRVPVCLGHQPAVATRLDAICDWHRRQERPR